MQPAATAETPEPFLSPSRLVFTGVIAVVVVALLAWAGTGRPFPGQHLPADIADLADPAVVSGQWGLVPAPPGGIDLSPMVPLPGWSGYAIAYVNADNVTLVSFTGAGDPHPDPDVVADSSGAVWQLAIGNQRGLAAVWPLDGHRHGGIVVWGANIPADAPQVLDALATVVRDNGV